MLNWLEKNVNRARERRSLHIFVIVLRMMIAFAFIPAGLKKVIGERFTAAEKTGPFNEFVHAFFDTGLLYHWVGALQLVAACLLMTQRFATLGAILMAPILFTILVFCWGVMVIPTATVVTLMSLGIVGLLLWDIHKLKLLFMEDGQQVNFTLPGPHPNIDMTLWTRCGWLILILYFGTAALTQSVYRPMGADWSNPSFIVLQMITVLPLITFIIDYRRSKGARDRSSLQDFADGEDAGRG